MSAISKKSVIVIILLLSMVMFSAAQEEIDTELFEVVMGATATGQGNLRSDASTQNASVGQLQRGDEVIILEEIPDGQAVNGNSLWYKVRLADGTEAYAWAGLLTEPEVIDVYCREVFDPPVLEGNDSWVIEHNRTDAYVYNPEYQSIQLKTSEVIPASSLSEPAVPVTTAELEAISGESSGIIISEQYVNLPNCQKTEVPVVYTEHSEEENFIPLWADEAKEDIEFIPVEDVRTVLVLGEEAQRMNETLPGLLRTAIRSWEQLEEIVGNNDLLWEFNAELADEMAALLEDGNSIRFQQNPDTGELEVIAVEWPGVELPPGIAVRNADIMAHEGRQGYSSDVWRVPTACFPGETRLINEVVVNGSTEFTNTLGEDGIRPWGTYIDNSRYEMFARGISTDGNRIPQKYRIPDYFAEEGITWNPGDRPEGFKDRSLRRLSELVFEETSSTVSFDDFCRMSAEDPDQIGEVWIITNAGWVAVNPATVNMDMIMTYRASSTAVNGVDISWDEESETLTIYSQVPPFIENPEAAIRKRGFVGGSLHSAPTHVVEVWLATSEEKSIFMRNNTHNSLVDAFFGENTENRIEDGYDWSEGIRASGN